MRPLIASEETAKAAIVSTESARLLRKGDTETPTRILLVEDQIVARRALERMLVEAGHEVQSCRSGQEAMPRLQQDSFDLVITDLSPPVTDAFEVVRQAKRLDPVCEVIVVTANTNPKSVVELMRLGACDCIRKPSDIDEIKDDITVSVDWALERRRRVLAAGSTDVHTDDSSNDFLTVEFDRSERQIRPMSLLMVGLDGLNTDALGVADSYAVLQEVAGLVKESVRSCDIVSRHRADQVAVVLAETSKRDALYTAERLRRLIEETDATQSEVSVHKASGRTASVGVASFPTDASQQTKLVAKAEQALRQARQLGGNTVRAAEQELSLMGSYSEKRLYFRCKRCIDIAGSVLLLLAGFPLILLIALLIKVDSPGPVFFHQPRVGLRKRIVHGQTVWELTTFLMHKFRTMHHESGRGEHRRFMKALIEENDDEVARLWHNAGHALKKLTEDPRITRVGKVIRKIALDELPQIWNVLKGEMSLVGPRPPIPYEIAEYEPRYWRRLEAIPGCTGLWQVSGWNKLGYKEQVELDIWYINHQSLWLDMKILLQTVPAVLRRTGGG